MLQKYPTSKIPIQQIIQKALYISKSCHANDTIADTSKYEDLKVGLASSFKALSPFSESKSPKTKEILSALQNKTALLSESFRGIWSRPIAAAIPKDSKGTSLDKLETTKETCEPEVWLDAEKESGTVMPDSLWDLGDESDPEDAVDYNELDKNEYFID